MLRLTWCLAPKAPGLRAAGGDERLGAECGAGGPGGLRGLEAAGARPNARGAISVPPCGGMLRVQHVRVVGRLTKGMGEGLAASRHGRLQAAHTLCK